MNNLRGIYTIWYRDLLRFWRDKARMFSSMIMPLLFLLVFGTGLSSRLGLFGDGINFSQFLFPGIIGMTVLMSALMSGMSVVWDREFGFLKEVLVAPISRASVAVGKTLGAATISLIQGAFVLLLAPVIGVSFSIGTMLVLLPLMFMLAASLASLGVLMATRIKSMEAFQAIMQLMVMPMVFLSGVFFPVAGLPAWMNALVKLNPATYGIDSIRQVMLGVSSDGQLALSLFGYNLSAWNDVLIMAVFGGIMITLAMWSFSKQY